MKLVHAYDFLKLVEGSVDETPVSNYGYQELAGRVMQDLLDYAEENPGTAKAKIIREWAELHIQEWKMQLERMSASDTPVD